MIKQILIAKWLKLLFMSFLLIIAISFSVFAQAQDPRFVLQVSSKVLSIDGNIVHLSGGVTADLSESKFKRANGFPIENKPLISVGSLVSVQGLVTSELGQPIFIKSSSTIVETGKEFSFWGFLQAVKAKKNTITILNQKINVDPNSMILDEKGNTVTLSSIKKGDKVDLTTIKLINGLVTDQILKFKGDPPGQITGYIKSMNGATLELESGFVFDLTSILKGSVGQEDELFKNPKYYTPGTEVIIGLSSKTAMSPPQGVIPVDGGFGFSKAPITIDTKLQAVDLVEKTITVLNHKISIPDNLFIEGPRGKITIEQLVVGKDILIFADLNDADIIPKVAFQVFIN